MKRQSEESYHKKTEGKVIKLRKNTRVVNKNSDRRNCKLQGGSRTAERKPGKNVGENDHGTTNKGVTGERCCREKCVIITGLKENSLIRIKNRKGKRVQEL